MASAPAFSKPTTSTLPCRWHVASRLSFSRRCKVAAVAPSRQPGSSTTERATMRPSACCSATRLNISASGNSGITAPRCRLPSVVPRLRWRQAPGGQRMITKFDSLYAGAVDLDDVGYGGTPINDRRYSNEHLATALEKAQSMAVLMDRLG